MADPRWGYSPSAKRYRDLDSGRFLPRKTVTDIRDRVVDAAGREARDLAEQVVRGEITPDAFRQGMRVVVRNAHAANAIFGRGGINAMTSADFGRLGSTLRTQFAYLEGFVQAVENGSLSEAQAAARAQLYVNGATRSFEEGQAAAWGIAGQLPCQPADMGTPCGSNCRCRWDLRETETTIDAYWRLSAGESCVGCEGRAASYAPFSIPKPYAVPDATPVRLAVVPRLQVVRSA